MKFWTIDSITSLNIDLCYKKFMNDWTPTIKVKKRINKNCKKKCMVFYNVIIVIKI